MSQRELAPGPSRLVLRPGLAAQAAGPARRPTSSISRRAAAGACCQGRMKSSPREVWILVITIMRQGQGGSRSGRGAADPRPFPHSTGLCSALPNLGAAAMEWPTEPRPPSCLALEFRLLLSQPFSPVDISGVVCNKCTFLVAMSKQPAQTSCKPEENRSSQIKATPDPALGIIIMTIFLFLMTIAHQLQISQHNFRRTVHHAQTYFPCDLRQNLLPSTI